MLQSKSRKGHVIEQADEEEQRLRSQRDRDIVRIITDLLKTAEQNHLPMMHLLPHLNDVFPDGHRIRDGDVRRILRDIECDLEVRETDSLQGDSVRFESLCPDVNAGGNIVVSFKNSSTMPTHANSLC